ncbi:MAG: hypothetical protein IIT78_00930 [Mycoplasmataceae bacterium]|nr:hypothetical protein [Mycoplasmataceae bacterium]
MKKSIKIGMIISTLSIITASIATTTVLINKNSSTSSNQNLKNNSILNNLSDKWVNSSTTNTYIQNMFNEFTNPKTFENNNSTFISFFKNNIDEYNKTFNYNELTNIRKLSISDQNKIKNAMLSIYTSLRNKLELKEQSKKSYFDVLKPYLNNNVIKQIEENIKNSNISKNKDSNFFILPICSLSSNTNLQQLASNLQEASNIASNIATAAGILAGLTAVAAIFVDSLWAIVSAASIVCTIAGAVSSALWIAYQSIYANIGQAPQGWLTAVNALSSTTSLGGSISSIVITITKALDSLGAWASVIPGLNALILILTTILNNVNL